MTDSKFYKKAFRNLLMAKLLKAEPEEFMYQLAELFERYQEDEIPKKSK